MAVLWVLVAIFAGVSNPLQSAANAELNKQLGQPIWAGIIVYATGLLGLLLIQFAARSHVPLQQAGDVHWWAWCGGAISLLATMAGLLLAQKLGSGTFTALSVTAAIASSVLLDHFALLGMKQHSASPGRLAGCALLVAGVWLVAKF